jgi:predicted nuclease of predicted toxin-antitoxin system
VRILADENFPGEAVQALRQRGHDVFWVRTDAPGSSDDAVLRRAQLEARVLLTMDKDFGELAFRAGLPASSGIVLFRMGAALFGQPETLRTQAVVCLRRGIRGRPMGCNG